MKVLHVPAVIVAVAVAVAVAGCSSTKSIDLQERYTGPIPPVHADGEPIEFSLAVIGPLEPYGTDTLAHSRYDVLARDALRQAGYVVVDDAATEVAVELRAAEGGEIITSESNTARNIGVGILTLGLSCKEMIHTVDAVGTVTVTRDGQGKVERLLPMKATDTSCENTMNPQWLANHEEAAVRLYESAIQKHIGDWLPFITGTH